MQICKMKDEREEEAFQFYCHQREIIPELEIYTLVYNMVNAVKCHFKNELKRKGLDKIIEELDEKSDQI